MDLSNANTAQNLEAAFAGEAMANRKYLFFADVAKKLGMADLAKLFRDTANQETEHAFAHFRLMHPELDIQQTDALSEEEKQAIASRCLQLAIDGETYEYQTMYPQFTAEAKQDADPEAMAEFQAQAKESQEHAGIFRRAAHNFGLLTTVEQHHAQRYTEALTVLEGGSIDNTVVNDNSKSTKWICRQCSVIYDPSIGDPDSGIAPGTAFHDIPEDWSCPICGASKASFVLYQEPKVA